MTAALLVTAFALIVTKALDGLSTLRAVHDPDAETNPLARPLMRRCGVRATAALVFGLAVLIVAAALGLVWLSGSRLFAWVFVVVGLGVALVQLAVAHTNWTGRWNPITRRVLRAHRWAAARRLPLTTRCADPDRS